MVLIRKANRDDCLDIAAIHITSWGTTYAKLLPKSYISQNNNLATKINLWQEISTHPHVTIWIASDNKGGERSVGFISYYNKGGDYEITTLYVLSDYHRLGVGTQLMSAALTDILASNHDANGSPNLSLWVLKTNVAAVDFYKKQGFIVSAESCEEIYEGSKIVDIKMVKALDDEIEVI